MWEVSLAWKQVNSLAKRFTLRELPIGGNYVWYLIIVVIFMGLGGAERWDGEAFKNVMWGGQATKRVDQIIWERLASLDTMTNNQ